MENINLLKKNVAEYMSLLCERGLTTILGGNISCRTKNGMIITPSSINKLKLIDTDIIEMDFSGNILEGQYKPSIEHRIHSCIYQARPDVNAIIHAHSFYATLFSIIDKEINIEITAESAKNIGIIGVANYATMGTEALANGLVPKVKKHNVVLMKNHGIISTGEDLLQAFYRLEIAEQTARLTYYSTGIPCTTISSNDLENYLRKKDSK